MSDKAIFESGSDTDPSFVPYRPALAVNSIARYIQAHRNDGYVYKGVIIYTNAAMAMNFDNHLKAGYEVVYDRGDDTLIKDDRAFSANTNTKGSRAPSPILNKVKHGAEWLEQVLMRIKEEDLDKLKESQAKTSFDTYKASTQSITNRGNHTMIKGDELNLSKSK